MSTNNYIFVFVVNPKQLGLIAYVLDNNNQYQLLTSLYYDNDDFQSNILSNLNYLSVKSFFAKAYESISKMLKIAAPKKMLISYEFDSFETTFLPADSHNGEDERNFETLVNQWQYKEIIPGYTLVNLHCLQVVKNQQNQSKIITYSIKADDCSIIKKIMHEHGISNFKFVITKCYLFNNTALINCRDDQLQLVIDFQQTNTYLYVYVNNFLCEKIKLNEKIDDLTLTSLITLLSKQFDLATLQTQAYLNNDTNSDDLILKYNLNSKQLYSANFLYGCQLSAVIKKQIQNYLVSLATKKLVAIIPKYNCSQAILYLWSNYNNFNLICSELLINEASWWANAYISLNSTRRYSITEKDLFVQLNAQTATRALFLYLEQIETNTLLKPKQINVNQQWFKQDFQV